MMDCPVALLVATLPIQRSPWRRLGLTVLPCVSNGRNSLGITFPSKAFDSSWSSSLGPLPSSSMASICRIPLEKNSSQVFVQAFSCGRFPLYVVMWKPNILFGELLSLCNFASSLAKFAVEGGPLSRSWNSNRRKWRPDSAQEPQQIGRGAKEGDTLHISRIDSYSPFIIASPRSPVAI